MTTPGVYEKEIEVMTQAIVEALSSYYVLGGRVSDYAARIAATAGHRALEDFNLSKYKNGFDKVVFFGEPAQHHDNKSGDFAELKIDEIKLTVTATRSVDRPNDVLTAEEGAEFIILKGD